MIGLPSIASPWVWLAGVALFAGGYWYGGSNADQACDLEAAEARGVAAGRFQAELEKTTEASMTIKDISASLQGSFIITREKTRTIEVEVASDVAAHPDLALCLVPERTRQLRDQQVSDSAAIAAQSAAVRR
jgi:hypothetical protein